jgi:7-cyano-7-deazaguanine synthase
MPLADLYGNHWSITGNDVPDDASPDEAVFLPGRNPLLLIKPACNPLLLIKPALWCVARGVEQLAMATLANNPFDDATPEFFSQFEGMIRAATGARVQITRPFEKLTKSRVMEMGRNLPLHLTFSCLSPVGELHCGRCNKCNERRVAFQSVGIEDATEYAPLVAASLRDADGW